MKDVENKISYFRRALRLTLSLLNTVTNTVVKIKRFISKNSI